MADIGLPKIEINFKQLAVSAVQRSARGIVALIIKDDTDSNFDIVEYKSSTEIETNKFTKENASCIKDAFLGTPAKVIIVRVDTTSTDVVADAIAILAGKKYNWIGLAEGTPTEQQDLATYVKEQEAQNKTIKAVTYNAITTDCMHVVNFINPKVTYKDERKEIEGQKYVARLLGVLAGLPMTRSSTYYVFQDLESVEEPNDIEKAINQGKFVLINDEEEVKVARGVNSLVTTGANKTDDMKKIIVVESMDLIREDIYSTFKKFYLGKYKNRYDNQILFISAINSYFKDLANEEILDSNFANKSFVDVETQRSAWLSIGKTEAELWDEKTIKNNTFRSNVYLAGNIKILDAMEDFKFNITMI